MNEQTLTLELTLPFSPTGDCADEKDVTVRYEATESEFAEWFRIQSKHRNVADDAHFAFNCACRGWDDWDKGIKDHFKRYLESDPSRFEVGSDGSVKRIGGGNDGSR